MGNFLVSRKKFMIIAVFSLFLTNSTAFAAEGFRHWFDRDYSTWWYPVVYAIAPSSTQTLTIRWTGVNVWGNCVSGQEVMKDQPSSQWSTNQTIKGKVEGSGYPFSGVRAVLEGSYTTISSGLKPAVWKYTGDMVDDFHYKIFADGIGYFGDWHSSPNICTQSADIAHSNPAILGSSLEYSKKVEFVLNCLEGSFGFSKSTAESYYNPKNGWYTRTYSGGYGLLVKSINSTSVYYQIPRKAWKRLGNTEDVNRNYCRMWN